jgi:hypothetical protein
MKRKVMSGAFLVLVAVLFSGCMTYHVSIKPQYLPESSSIKLNITKPVAIVNVCSKAPHAEDDMGHWVGWNIKGSLYDFTEVTVEITKKILQRNNIIIDDKADKRLELSVDDAESVQGTSGFILSNSVTLKVKTGSGLQRKFQGLKRYGTTGYVYSLMEKSNSAFEMALAQSVELMLNDKYIIEYLEK